MLLDQIDLSGRLWFGVQAIAVCFSFYLLGVVIYNRYFHPYKDIPGPFWASVSSVWYSNSMLYGKAQNMQYPVHEQYGPAVRLAPNLVSISDPAAIEIIYGSKKVFQKSNWYLSFVINKCDTFSERNERLHAKRQRLTAPLYTQNNVLAHEPHIDRVVKLLCLQMDKFCQTNEVFDISLWIRKYSFDIIGELFYGLEGGFGMIRDDIDYNGWLHLLEVMTPYLSSMSYLPKGLQTAFVMSVLLRKEGRDAMTGANLMVEQAKAATKLRLREMASPDFKRKDDNLQLMMDMIAEKSSEGSWTLDDVTTELCMLMAGGSDTAAGALISIFYFLHKHPAVLNKLHDELDNAFASGKLSLPVRYNDAIKIRYLWAVVQESMRMHPPVGTGLPRVVPPGGAEICGRFYAEGCEVLMNPMVVNFNEDVFGSNPHQFDPERWLRVDAKKVGQMERCTLNFGRGPRTCMGRQIAITEMYKLLPTILNDFRFELAVDRWTTFDGWFAHKKNVMVRVERRLSKVPGESVTAQR